MLKWDIEKVVMRRNKENRPSESFILGVVALVFMIIGYQTAMFVYKAAVMRIEANRDEPDTVYVCSLPEASSGQVREDEVKRPAGKILPSGIQTNAGATVRRNAVHSQRVESIRNTIPCRKVESFRFDPNTVAEEELCRLGFSQKQAQSIINYRGKGGHFRRKEDFAKSFVVSDSIYRRLEPYIDIPLLDLNTADSAAFDALPGIGGWFAVKMIEHRNALKGYSYKEQLLDIWKFDQAKFDGLSDLVTVDPENVIPYPLWTYPADSLRKHPYIGNYETARSIVLYRENTPRSEWTVKNLSAAGILSESAAERLEHCRIARP